MEDRKVMSQTMRQYILTGAGLGLYFGWFFRPMREPSFTIVFGLSLFIALVMTAIRFFRGQREQLLRRALSSYVRYIIVLGVLEGRHLAFDAGGRVAVIGMTVVLGALMGAWLAYQDVA